MSSRSEVLVAIMNQPRDFAIARDDHWYRIPVRSAKRLLKNRWPPEWLAFYQTKVFIQEAYAINYYAKVIQINEVPRCELFPNEPQNRKSNRRYYQLHLEPLLRLPAPIFSRRFRRITFISTTWDKFINAVEINDLFDASPLEDLLWAQLKRLQIHAQRQEHVTVKRKNYFLDFAVHCAKGKIDIETDGDTWHANPQKARLDNVRDNDLESVGWQSLRFSTKQIREEMEEYCVPTIVKTINNLGGVQEEDQYIPRKVNLKTPPRTYQLSLFDDYDPKG